jgi:3-keto-disaccharide hydrolase
MRSVTPILAAILSLVAAGNAAEQKTGDWKPLFDGKSVAGWRETPFTGHAEVRVDNAAIVLNAGNPMTGITWTGAFPKSNYEIRFEAERRQGNDFFASLTFPVGDSFATWVTGGWGGDIVGISSIDGWDASDNETRQYFNFENGRWYPLRLRVTDGRIEGWIGEQQIVNVSIEGRAVGLRYGEIKLSAPLGFASYLTTGALRKIEYRLLP